MGTKGQLRPANVAAVNSEYIKQAAAVVLGYISAQKEGEGRTRALGMQQNIVDKATEIYAENAPQNASTGRRERKPNPPNIGRKDPRATVRVSSVRITSRAKARRSKTRAKR